MEINIDLDEDLTAQASRLSGVSDLKELIEESLRCLIKLRQQSDIRQLFGKYPLDIDYVRSRRG